MTRLVARSLVVALSLGGCATGMVTSDSDGGSLGDAGPAQAGARVAAPFEWNKNGARRR
mgnify:CR=1 FL=1